MNKAVEKKQHHGVRKRVMMTQKCIQPVQLDDFPDITKLKFINNFFLFKLLDDNLILLMMIKIFKYQCEDRKLHEFDRLLFDFDPRQHA